MSRISTTFARLRSRGERAFIPYLTAGDPSLEVTRALVLEAEARGADLIELGFPFSDPLADGPIIQRASQRALDGGVTLLGLLDLARELRGRLRAPLILMTYMNPLLAYGLEAVTKEASAGFDGLIVPDLPLEEAGPLQRGARQAGLDLIFLVAPTSSPERIRLIARKTRGFLYAVSLRGVTGPRAQLPSDLVSYLQGIRAVTEKPISVGFGISHPEQVRALAAYADGVIVGSALVHLVEEGGKDAVRRVGDFVATLKAVTRE
ncbi:MAG: tryptophan synthase subunit alpha [Candidatus Rokubacteria bacterium]|nr:tryptophan synthase subunit alpha [Candidatus Rokubacteria bacterium]